MKTQALIILGTAALLALSCSSGSKKQNVMDGKYNLAGNQLIMDLKIPAGDGGEEIPQNFDLNRKLGAAPAGAPEVSGVWVGTITSGSEETDILVWLKEDGGFVAADAKEYRWKITGGNLSFTNPDSTIDPDTPVIPATEAQLESGSFTFSFTENGQTVTVQMERIVAGNSWYGLWGATFSNIPTGLVPPSGYTHIGLFEDDGTFWEGEVTGEGSYNTSESSMSIEITWPPTASDKNRLCDDCSNFQETIPAEAYNLGHIQIGPGTPRGFSSVTISTGAVLIGDETSGKIDDLNGGIIQIETGGTLTANGVAFQNMQFFYVGDGATLVIENSAIEFARWPGCRALGPEANFYNYGFTLGTGSKLVLRNSTVTSTGEIICLIAAQGNPEYFGKANQVDITIENNTITTDAPGGIALAAGVIRGNTITFTQANNPYGIMADKIETPLTGKGALEIENNTFISPNSGRAIVFTRFFPPAPGVENCPTNIVGNQFTGFPSVFVSELCMTEQCTSPYLYSQDLNISGNTYTDCGQIYIPMEEFLYDSQEYYPGDPINMAEGPGGPGIPSPQTTRALTEGDTDTIDFSFMSATGTAGLKLDFSGLSLGLKLHCVITRYDKSVTPNVFEPVGVYDATAAGEDWSITLNSVDRAKTYRIELTAGSGGDPVGNYTVKFTVN